MLLIGGGLAARGPADRRAAPTSLCRSQVSVLTEAPGLSAPEVERNVTFPMENALNGVPGLEELRSVSAPTSARSRSCSATGTDPWFARQLVFERMLQARGDLPEACRRRRSPRSAPASGRSISSWSARRCTRNGLPDAARLGDRAAPARRARRHRGQHQGRRAQAVPGHRPARPPRPPTASPPRSSETAASASAIISGGYIDRPPSPSPCGPSAPTPASRTSGVRPRRSRPTARRSSSSTSPACAARRGPAYGIVTYMGKDRRSRRRHHDAAQARTAATSCTWSGRRGGPGRRRRRAAVIEAAGTTRRRGGCSTRARWRAPPARGEEHPRGRRRWCSSC